MATPSFDDLLNKLETETTSESIAQLERFLHTQAPAGSHPGVLVRLLVDRIEQLPEPVQDTLYPLLCDQNNPLRKTVSSLISNEGASFATTALVGGLGALVTGPVGPAVGLVAGIIVKLITDSANQDFSEEINQARAEHHLKALQQEQTAEPPAPARTKAAGRVKKPASQAPKRKAAGARAPRKKTTAEPKPAVHPKPDRQEEEKVKPARAKKPSTASSKAPRRPAAVRPKKGGATGKPPASGRPARKSTPRSVPKTTPARKTAKKENG